MAEEKRQSPWPLILMAAVAVLLVGGWFAYPYLDEYWQSRPITATTRAMGNCWTSWSWRSCRRRRPRRRRTGLNGADRGAMAFPPKPAWPRTGRPPAPRLIWRAKTGEGYSAPSIAGGRLFLIVQDGDKEAVVCWDADKGTEHWRHAYPAHFSNLESGVGPHASPTIDGDRVYTVGATGMLFCLAVADGKEIWSHDLLKEFKVTNQEYGVSFSPLIEGDLLITVPGGAGGTRPSPSTRKTARWSGKRSTTAPATARLSPPPLPASGRS